MEKKRSLGVTIFGFLVVLPSLLFWISQFRELIERDMGIGGDKEFWLEYIYAGIFGIFISAFFILLCIGILRLKNWARLIYLCYVWIIQLTFAIFLFGFSYNDILNTRSPLGVKISSAIFLVYTILPIIFFTRPKVKEQFKK